MNNGNPAIVTTADSTSFKFKSCILENPNNSGVLENGKIVVTIKYLSNFWSSLEMPLINCKVQLKWNWTEKCVMYNIVRDTTLKITNTKLYVPNFTLLTKENVKLT